MPRRRLGRLVPVRACKRRHESRQLCVRRLEALKGRRSAGAAGRLYHGRRNLHRVEGRQKPSWLAAPADPDRQGPEPVHPGQVLHDVLDGPSAAPAGRVPFPSGEPAERFCQPCALADQRCGRGAHHGIDIDDGRTTVTRRNPHRPHPSSGPAAGPPAARPDRGGLLLHLRRQVIRQERRRPSWPPAWTTCTPATPWSYPAWTGCPGPWPT